MKYKNKYLQISCDGGAATGKSTGAKMIARKYNLKFLSSGLLYRYASYLILKFKPKNKITFLKKKFKSLKHVVNEAKLKLKKGFSIILFPEGTRVKPEKGIQRFGSSCGLISYENKVPIIPVCHNSGKYWRNREFRKYPGTVRLRIGKPIEALSAKDATNKAYDWVKLNYQEIN